MNPAPLDFACSPTPQRDSLAACAGYASSCGRVTLYLGDCRELMAAMKADAVITDPPYGIKRDKGMGGGGYDSTGRWKRKARQYAGGWDAEPADAELLEMVIAAAPVAVLWGGNYLPLGRGGKWLVWNKEQVMPSYSDAELAWTNADGESVKLYTLHCNKARIEMGLHPTQKPVQLMAWSMDQAKVPEGATVLDPFMGSGSTAIACIRTGRRFIGIERDPGHYATAVERIRRELEGDLFHSQHNNEFADAERSAQRSVQKI